MEKYTLYGAKISYFTGKLRSYLRYKDIPFDEVLSSLKVYKKVIVPETGVRFIPVLKTPKGECLQDTTVIIDYLEAQYEPRSVFPQQPKQLLMAKLFELVADEWFLLPAMHYRWNRPQEKYLYAEFGKTVLPGWPGFIQRYIGKKAGGKFRGFVPKLGINSTTIPAIEHWFEEQFLPLFERHLTEHSYLLGERASIGDFALVGPLYAHLYLDPEPGKMMRTRAPAVCKWIERLNSHEQVCGDWLENDDVPDTLLEIMRTILKDFLPICTNTVKQLSLWRSEHQHDAIPRALNTQSFTIGDVTAEKAILPFTQWKLQRVLAAINPDEHSLLTPLLTAIGAQALLELDIENPLKRVNNRLVWA